jgi:hypothetical protein
LGALSLFRDFARVTGNREVIHSQFLVDRRYTQCLSPLELRGFKLPYNESPTEAAAVKTLVLSHRVPAGDPEVTDQMWIDSARKYFHGPIIVGRDLLEI